MSRHRTGVLTPTASSSLQLPHMPQLLILLLLLVVVFRLGDVGPLTAAAATPINFRDFFVGRCEDYQRVVFPHFIDQPKNCSDLWHKFYWSFAYKDPCRLDIDSYDEFIQASRHNISTLNKIMYWSGRVIPLVYEFTADTRRYVTIRDYLPGYIVKDVYAWCGKNESVDEGLGMDFESCPAWGSCGNNLESSESFWKGLSASFARSVQGEVRVMLNGSSGDAYRGNRSTFGGYELANLEASRNPVLHVYLVHDVEPRPNSVRETCHNGTLLQLKTDVENKGMVFNCVDDPLDVLYLQCVDYTSSDRCRQLINSAPVDDKLTISLSIIAFSLLRRSVTLHNV